jgi:type 1 glutamine amidotransferase
MAAFRIAALVGDFYHEPAPMAAALKIAAGELDASLEVFVDPALLPWEKLADFSALIVAREARVAPKESDAAWNTERHEKAIEDFVTAGGALLGLHAGLASYGRDGLYTHTIRGGFIHHPSEHPLFQVRPTGAAHPLLQGVKPMSFTDEMYFVRIDSADTTLLLESVSPDYGSSAASWAHAHGEGRVFCFTPGHRAEVLADAAYLLYLGRGLRWALGIL